MSRLGTLLTLLGFCLGTPLVGCSSGPSMPRVESGVVDLTGWDFQKDGSVPLIGEWQFHWKELIPPEEAWQARPIPQLIGVPGLWNRLEDLNNPGERLGPYGYATYMIKVKGLTPGNRLGLRMWVATSAYELYWIESEGEIPSEPLMNSGSVKPNQIIPHINMRAATFEAKSREAIIVMHVGNEYVALGGLPTPLTIGPSKDITNWEKNWFVLANMCIGVMLVMALYHFILFLIYREDRASLYFALLCSVLAIYSTALFMQLHHLLIPEPSVSNFMIWMYVIFVGSYFAPALLVSFIRAIYPEEFPPLFPKAVWAIMLVFSGLCLILGFPMAVYLNIPYFVVTIVVLGLSNVYLLRARANKRTGSMTLLAIFALLGVCCIYDSLGFSGLLKHYEMILTPLGVLLIIISQSVILSKRLVFSLHDIRQLSSGLQVEIEERKLVQEELEIALGAAKEAEKLKNAFLANVSHELRTPLNSIINIPASLRDQFEQCPMWFCAQCGAVFEDDTLLGEAKREGPPELCPDCQVPMEIKPMLIFGGNPEEHYRYLGMLGKSGKQFFGVVTDLMDISQLDAGNLQLKKVPVDARNVLDEVQTTVAPLVAQNNLRIQYTTLDEPLNLRADSNRLSQIFINLIRNAIEYTDPGGEISIRVQRDYTDPGNPPCTLFSVSDNGAGIPVEWQTKIFESFRQVDESHTRLHQGTGVGLAITRQLVVLHGGRIWVESQVGEGSTFFFTIPTLSSQETPIREVG